MNAILMPGPIRHVITVDQLLGILNLNRAGKTFPDIITQDKRLVYSFGRDLPPIRQDGIVGIMQDRQFQYWFKSANSETLSISGLERDFYAHEPVSPLSYMCELLGQTKSGLRSTTPLNFFCG